MTASWMRRFGRRWRRRGGRLRRVRRRWRGGEEEGEGERRCGCWRVSPLYLRREDADTIYYVHRPKVDPSTQLWTTRYAPQTIKDICGNKAQVEKLQQWLMDWCVCVLPDSPFSRSFSFAFSLFVSSLLFPLVVFPALRPLNLTTDSPSLPPFRMHNRLPILYNTQAKFPQSLLPQTGQKRDEHVPRRPHNGVTWYREDDECASLSEIGGVCAG
jgi:hypothetical protein